MPRARRVPSCCKNCSPKAREAKISLSERSRDTGELRCGDRVRTIELERCEFEKMTQHLVERTRMTLQSMLERKDLQYGHLTVVLLVGGRKPHAHDSQDAGPGNQPRDRR